MPRPGPQSSAGSAIIATTAPARSCWAQGQPNGRVRVRITENEVEHDETEDKGQRHRPLQLLGIVLVRRCGANRSEERGVKKVDQQEIDDEVDQKRGGNIDLRQ